MPRRKKWLNRSALTDIILPEYGLCVKTIKPMTAGVMNENVRVTTDLGTVVVRRSPKKSATETQFERTMLGTLASQQFPCPHPMLTKNGHDHLVMNGHPVMVYPLLSGRAVTRGTPSIMRQLGLWQAMIHTTIVHLPHARTQRTWDPDDLKKLARRHRTILARSSVPLLNDLAPWIERELNDFHFPATLPRGMTHQDIKPENVLIRNGRVSGILDFDNAYNGVLLHDLTTTILWWCFPNGRLDRHLADAFIKGYERRRRLTRDERRLLLTEGLRFRFIREMFIGPLTTLDQPTILKKRLAHFWKLYQNTFGSKEKSAPR